MHISIFIWLYICTYISYKKKLNMLNTQYYCINIIYCNCTIVIQLIMYEKGSSYLAERFLVRARILPSNLEAIFTNSSNKNRVASRLSCIVLRLFPRRKQRSIFVVAKRKIITARSRERERKRERLCREWRENGRQQRRKEKLRGNFRMRERFIGRSDVRCHALCERCTMHHGKKNEIKESILSTKPQRSGNICIETSNYE